MHVLRDTSWMRRGTTLLWEPRALAEVASPSEVVSIRQLFALARSWPENLPSSGGNVLVVAGLEGCIDAVSADDAERWLEEELGPLLHSFQSEYQGQAALVLWVPSGRQRIRMSPATESYQLRCVPPHSQRSLDIGRLLFGGAQQDVRRIIVSAEPQPDVDGDAWVGLYQKWIS